jgi:hypothetical protein
LDRCDPSKTGFEVRYKGELVGVRLLYRTRDNFLVRVAVLEENGDFPTLSGELRPDSAIREFDLEDIEALDPSSRSAASEQPFGLPDANGIGDRADRLRDSAGDLLSGDLRRVPLLEQRVLARAEAVAWRKWGDRAVEFGWTKPPL